MDLRGKRVVVMGLGCFSGGVSAARFAAHRGARVIVTDAAPPWQLEESIAALTDEPIEALHLGGHCELDFQRADLIIANPAVREDNPFLQIARRHGATITTEMNLFFQLCRAPIVGITGSNGKSTTTALIHSMLTSAGLVPWLGGNIGRSLLEHVDEIGPESLVVLELSSFQLHALHEIRKSPSVAVVTTFTPNHLDRHPTLQDYRNAKQAILRYQKATDLTVLNADDPDVRQWPAKCPTLFYGLNDHRREGAYCHGNRFVFRRGGTEERFELLDVLRLPGQHNQSNVAGAACCAMALGADAGAIRRAVASFTALPHRLETIDEFAGRRFYDDSIATTPESTMVALDSVREPIWLIAGGHDKGTDMTALARVIARRVRGVAFLGQTGPALRRLVEGLITESRPVNIQECASMEEAVAWCYYRSMPGDAILLSPACASFGMFQNFVDRARAFRQAVKNLRAWRQQAA